MVLCTRDEAGNAAFARAIASRGGRTLDLPLIRILPPVDREPLGASIASLHEFDWIVFTSAHAVAAACGDDRWREAWSQPVRPRVAVVGPATAEALAERGVQPDVVAEGTATSLVEHLCRAHDTATPPRVLWPRSDRSRRELPDGLRAAGASLVDPIAYRTCAGAPQGFREAIDAIAGGEIDAAAFFSPSAVHACAEGLPGGSLAPVFDRLLVGSIGPTTSAAIVQCGGRVDVEAAEPTAMDLSRAIMTRLLALLGARA